jgi:hypothetical protein
MGMKSNVEMGDSTGVLGILVHTDRYFEYALKLAEAASAKGRRVRVHLLDKGIGLLSSDSLRSLGRVAQISACAAGVQAAAATTPGLKASVEIVSHRHLPTLLQSFDRIVVF